MKSVLMIPYFFPPEGSAGVFRPLRFVRQLSKMGWDTTVVSADPYRYERYDQDLLSAIPKETEVIRVRGRDPWQRIQAWRGKRVQAKLLGAPIETMDRLHAAYRAPGRSLFRKTVRIIESYYYFPDIMKSWISPAVRAARLVGGRKHPKVIWATLGPVSAGVVAQRTSRFTGIPYVVDFRDPWGLSYYESEVSRPKQLGRLAHRNMYRILENAQAVIFLFPRMAECYWRAYRGALDAARIHIIPNGYEGTIGEFQIPPSDRCTILYSGNLATYRFDTLLQAIEYLKKHEPAKAKLIRLCFVGDGMNEMARAVAALGLADIVETSSPIPFAQIKQLEQDAHAFLILGRTTERRGHELVAGAKLFGYFKARRPILGVLPEDETKRILNEVGVRTIASAESMSEIVDSLKLILAAWSEGTLSSLLPHHGSCEKYSVEQQTLDLVRALEGKLSAVPFVPGSVEIPLSLRPLIGC